MKKNQALFTPFFLFLFIFHRKTFFCGEKDVNVHNRVGGSMSFSRKQHFFVEKHDFFVDFGFICFLFTKIVKNARLSLFCNHF